PVPKRDLPVPKRDLAAKMIKWI
ncbi:hypothetical protein NPIL_54471, partial [Nephila pilipes]